MFCLHDCMCTPSLPSASGGQKTALDPLVVASATWVLGSKPRSCGRIASILSPVPL